MCRIRKLSLFILLLGPLSSWASSCPQYLIHFINMELSFVAPPVPVEDNAVKVFTYRSCEIEKFVKSANLSSGSSNTSEALSRIKVTDKKKAVSFVIMQDEKVIAAGKEWSFDKDSLKSVLNEIYKEADKISQCQKCLPPSSEKKLLRKYGN